MRGLLIKGLDVTEVQACGLDDYYRLMEVDCIDIVSRKINGKLYDIICDDEALLKDKPIPKAFDTSKRPILYGNLIVAGFADDEGNLTDLNDEDIKGIIENVGIVRVYDERYTCLLNCTH